MTTQLKEKINISVEDLNKLSQVDLLNLCNITEQAINAGGGVRVVKSTNQRNFASILAKNNQ